MSKTNTRIRRMVMARNGITTVTREVTLNPTREVQTIEFAVQASNAGDVIASLVPVTDGVQIVESPQFLDLQSADSRGYHPPTPTGWDALLSDLKGQEVRVKRRGSLKSLKGTVGDVDDGSSTANGAVGKVVFLSVAQGPGASMVPVSLSDIVKLRPTNPEAQRKLNATLERARIHATKQNIVRVVVQATEENGSLSFLTAEPHPLPYPSYRLLIGEAGSSRLVLTTTLHNPGDTALDVETYTFVSDLPNSRKPPFDRPHVPQRRGMDDLFGPIAAGAVVHDDTEALFMESVDSVETGYPETMMGAAARPRHAMAASLEAKDVAGPRSKSAKRGFSFEYTCDHPIQLPPGGAVNVTLLDFNVPDAKQVLHWTAAKPGDPNRMVVFVVPGPDPLIKGPVTIVSSDGRCLGQAVIPDTYVGRKVRAAYAAEPGVSVRTTYRSGDQKLSFVSVKDGFLVRRSVTKTAFNYRLTNRTVDSFEFNLDHDKSSEAAVCRAKGTDDLKSTKTEKGVRLTFSLPANSEVTVTVTETVIGKDERRLTALKGEQVLELLHVTHLSTGAGLEELPQFQAVLELLKSRPTVAKEVDRLKKRCTVLKEEVTQLIAVCTALGANPSAAQHQDELSATLGEKKAAEADLSVAQEKLTELDEQIMEALNAISFEPEPEPASAS